MNKIFLLILFLFEGVFATTINESKKSYLHETGYLIEEVDKNKIGELMKLKTQFIIKEKKFNKEINEVRHEMNNHMLSEKDPEKYKELKEQMIFLMNEKEILRNDIKIAYRHVKPFKKNCRSCREKENPSINN